MSNFGILQLGVVNHDVAFRKAKSAVGTAALLENATEYKTVAEAVADCTLVVGTTAVRIIANCSIHFAALSMVHD